jgi:hypothetical protein
MMLNGITIQNSAFKMAQYNIPNQKQGDTFKGREFEVIINGSPKNLTNTAIRIDFRKDKKTGEVQKSLAVSTGITKTDALAGKFKIDAFLMDFPVGTYYYDVEFNDSGVITTYFEGSWTITQDVTN